MKSTGWTINAGLHLFGTACLLSLLAFNPALGINATDELPQQSSAITNSDDALDFSDTSMPSPEQIVAENTPAPSKPKARKAALTDPRGFHSTPYSDTKPGVGASKPSPTQPESEQRERLRPELHAAPTKPWYRKFYIRFDRGQDTPKTVNPVRFKNNAMLSGGIGYRFNDAFRVDLNFQSRHFETTRTASLKKMSQQAVFFNGYAQLMESGYLIPYLSAGIGFVKNQTKNAITIERNPVVQNTYTGKSTDNTVWNVGVGAIIPLWRLISIDVGYKFIDFGQFQGYNVRTVAGTVTNKSTLKNRIQVHEFVAGMMFNL